VSFGNLPKLEGPHLEEKKNFSAHSVSRRGPTKGNDVSLLEFGEIKRVSPRGEQVHPCLFDIKMGPHRIGQGSVRQIPSLDDLKDLGLKFQCVFPQYGMVNCCVWKLFMPRRLHLDILRLYYTPSISIGHG
jgi:hypothetical protein